MLSLIAKDILAIPISIVAFELAFGTKGRVLDVFQSSFSPRMTEALIYTQNWFRSTQINLNFKDDLVKVLVVIEKIVLGITLL